MPPRPAQRPPAKRYGLFHSASKQGVVAAPDLRPDTRRKEAPARFAGALIIKSMISAQTPCVCREEKPLEHDVIRWNRHHALALCLSMIFSENRFPLFRLML